MKKLALPIALLLVSGLAYAKGKPLADKQMDKISAGSAIANGESQASDSREFELELEGSAQKDASALNIVNAVDSLVANATNILSADHLFDIGRSEEEREVWRRKADVKQVNVIVQKGVPCDCKPGADWATSSNGREEERDWAFGNAIALDGSRATNKTEMELELEDHAQESAHALNIVNAVGSQVADATNIISAMNMHNLSSLTQVNVVVQLAH